MKIMSKKVIPAQKEIHVWLEKDGADIKIPVTMYRVWSSFFDTDPVFYCAGVHFVNPTDEALDSIQALIDTEESKYI